MDASQTLRQKLQEPGIIVAPGVYDCIGAKLAEQAGFPLIFTSGFGISAARLGLPDLGLLTASEMLQAAGNIVSSVQIPVIADMDTGYGNVLNVMRTIEEAVRLGIAGVILEDQEWPKKCGHFDNKRVISAKEHSQKIQAAIAARGKSELVIIARTDARGVHGLQEAIDRGQRYHDAGADIIFIEAPQSVEELKFIATHLPNIPLFANIIEGGKTPCLSVRELEELGYKLVAFALSGLFASVSAIAQYFQHLKQTGEVSQRHEFYQLEDFKQLINLTQYKVLENRFSKS